MTADFVYSFMTADFVYSFITADFVYSFMTADFVYSFMTADFVYSFMTADFVYSFMTADFIFYLKKKCTITSKLFNQPLIYYVIYKYQHTAGRFTLYPLMHPSKDNK